jgi:hypothetical protein
MKEASSSGNNTPAEHDDGIELDVSPSKQNDDRLLVRLGKKPVLKVGQLLELSFI